MDCPAKKLYKYFEIILSASHLIDQSQRCATIHDMNNHSEKFDVVVIGGGPAGMMAAGRAAMLGAKVALLEKNPQLGRKLLVTGKGRCNLTNAEISSNELVKKFGKNGKFLYSIFSVFGPSDVIQFFLDRDLPTKTERGGRVFPASDKSIDVLRVMHDFLKEARVKIFFSCMISDFELEGKLINSVRLKTAKGVRPNSRIFAKKFILCTGGKSYPLTGSTGDGYQWSRELGHTIVPPLPALVPIRTKEAWVKNIQGLSLKNVEIRLVQNGKKQDSRFGEMLFTHFGISGPIVLDLSKKAVQLMKNSRLLISIDLKPALDPIQLDQRLQRDFKQNLNRDFINYLPQLLPQKLIGTISKLSGINPRKKIHLITRDERKNLATLLKNLRMTADGTAGFEQAIITSGGVDIKEVDSKTMQSRLIDNLFFAGEILDLDGPTGGYNLQMCWSTGYAAGTHAALDFVDN